MSERVVMVVFTRFLSLSLSIRPAQGGVIKELFSTHQRESRYHKRHNFAAYGVSVSAICLRAHMTKYVLSQPKKRAVGTAMKKLFT